MSTEGNYSEELLDEYYEYVCTNRSNEFQCLPRPESEWIWALAVELIIYTIVAAFGLIGQSFFSILVITHYFSTIFGNSIVMTLTYYLLGLLKTKCYKFYITSDYSMQCVL